MKLPCALNAVFAAQSTLACTPPPNLSAIATAMLSAVNAARHSRNLAPLTLSAALTKAAQDLACDNADRRKVGHTGANGATLGSRLASVAYAYSNAAENAAVGFPNARSVTAGWMTSPQHRQNILTAPLRDLGVGVAKGSDGMLYWIIDMGVQ